MFKGFEDFQAMNKEGTDAVTASVAVWAKGFQTVATEVTENATKAFEGGSAAAEKAIAAKSVDKAFEIQTKFAKDSMEAYVNGMNRIGEIYAETARQAYKPLEVQAGKVGAKVNAKAAA
jgi:hypothetical protein